MNIIKNFLSKIGKQSKSENKKPILEIPSHQNKNIKEYECVIIQDEYIYKEIAKHIRQENEKHLITTLKLLGLKKFDFVFVFNNESTRADIIGKLKAAKNEGFVWSQYDAEQPYGESLFFYKNDHKYVGIHLDGDAFYELLKDSKLFRQVDDFLEE